MYTLYKYRPLYEWTGKTRVNHPFTESIFSKRELWYAAPEDFNDPFDCNLKLHARGTTDAEWKNYINIQIRQTKDRRTLAQLRKALNECLWKTRNLGATIGKDHDVHYKHSSVLCLSKPNNSIPMFSYYAADHRGIAIEFAFDVDSVPCGVTYRGGLNPYPKIVFKDVAYSQKAPDLNYIRQYNNPSLIDGMFFTKHYDWIHEGEFRIFRRTIPKGAANFHHNQLTRVIFGCRCTKEDEDLVKNWLSTWPSPVILSRAVPSDNEYDLKIVDFETLSPS